MDYSSPEHKDIYEIDIKDGNRIGRRLGRNIGSAASTMARGAKETLITEPFDPNAYDGDGDGIIQDGTVWKRPVVLRAQSVPGLTPQAVGEPDREAIRSDATDLPSPSAGITKRRKGTRAGLRSSTTPDTTSREWRDTATPQELAEAFVPDSLEESNRLAERTNVPRSSYATEEDYQLALALHREYATEATRNSDQAVASLQNAYDAKYGQGAFDRDPMPTLHENIQALFGSDKAFGRQFSNFSDEDEIGLQYQWIEMMSNLDSVPGPLKDIFKEVVTKVESRTPLIHGAFSYVDDDTRRLMPYPITPIEYVMARLVGEITINGQPQVPQVFIDRSEIDKPATPRRLTSRLEGWEAAELLMTQYFGLREAMIGGRALSDEQISARFALAKAIGTRRSLFGTVIPTLAGHRNNETAKANFYLGYSTDPMDYKMTRALVQRTLEQNPEFLNAVRRYGMPVIYLPHRAYTVLSEPEGLTEKLLVTPISELSPSELRERRLIGKHYIDALQKVKDDMQRQGDISPPENGGTNILGSFHINLGGSYLPGTNAMVITSDHLRKSIFNPPMADEGIVPLSKIKSLDDFVGDAGVLMHEYGHFMDFTILSTLVDAMWEREKREINILRASIGKRGAPSQGQVVTMTAMMIQRFRERINALPPRDGYQDVLNRHRALLNQLRNQRGIPTIERLNPDQRVKGPVMFDPSTLSDDKLNEQILELVSQINEIHGDSLLLRRRGMQRDAGRTGAQSLDSAEEISDDSMGSPEPYVITPYGNTNTRERFAEITAATLSRIGQKYPVLVNNSAVKLMARLTGMSTEQQDVTTLTRRVKLRGGRYSDETEDISDRIISTIKLVTPNSERSSDGHRPGLGSSTASSSLRFDPDERSRLESSSNIGIDTDERLYAFNEPLYVREFPSKPRTYSIGDHHFYDNDVSFGSRPSSEQRRTLGLAAAQAFTDRDQPHRGDMMRAISATQFGMFVDDMPTYETTTDEQLSVLRGLVTGKIAKLNPNDREQVERAFKDTNNLHLLVQMAQPTKRDIYRTINIDSQTFMESVTVGDVIPMPLTTFGADAPKKELGVTLRLIKGAKAVDDEGRFITQGNFEVIDISESDTGRPIATIRHTEVFDPRHNAMRAVAEGADTPRSMRSMGGSRPRYNEEQVSRMETDLLQRMDRATVFGLRSTTSSDGEDSGSIPELGNEEDGTSVDNDWLPEFLIPDPSEQALNYVEDKRNARTRDQILQTAFSSNEGIERDLFITGGTRLSKEQMGRLNGALVGRREPLGYLREQYGFNTTPNLFTRTDVGDRLLKLGTPLYGIGDINSNNESTSIPRFISGTGDSSSMIEFTSEPWRHLSEMYVDGLPNSDPATTRNGMLGYLAPWAQVTSRRSVKKALDEIIPTDEAQSLLADENFDSIIDRIALDHYRRFEYKPGFEVFDESFAFEGTPNTPEKIIRNRILKTILDVENNRRYQESIIASGSGRKHLETRNALLRTLFGDKPDRDEVVATLLGYDAIKTGSNTTLLNNGAMSVMDEAVSFAEAAQLLDDPSFRVIPKSVPFNVVGDADWFSEPSNARLLGRDEAIVLPANGVIPSSYIRSVRQDFNVDLSGRRGRGLSAKTTGRVSKILSMEQTMRRFDRQPNTDGWENPDDNDFKKKLADLKLRFKNITAEDEAWDEANMDLDEPDWDANKEIQSRKNAIIDHMTSLILTSNMVIEQAIEHEAAIQALAGFLKERDGDNALNDIPRDVLQAMDDMLNTLMNEANDRPSILGIDKARKRHVMLKKVLSDFDLGYDVRHSAAEFGDDDIELEDVDADVDVMDKSEAYLEHLFRGLFDENYDKWSERWSQFDRFISPENRSADDVMDKRFREVFKGITKEQRREWHAASGQLLDDEYNWEYEEDIIDATPVGGSTRPSEVPAPTWRKIRSAMSRARSTTFDGEKQAAEEAALRLIGKHRPDLATREYVRGIRSSTSGSLPASRVNFATKPMRGSRPDAPSTPVANQSLSITADKLRALGHDVTEEDLLPNGKVGAVMRNLTFTGGWKVIIGAGENDTLNTATRNTADLELFIMAVEKGLIANSSLGSNSPELIRDLVSITTEQARKQGLSIIKVEGHSSKKVLGPIDDEVIDILGDEVDIALLRAHGSPTYEQLADIAAYYYAEKKRLNKMFGEKDNDTPSQYVGKGAYGRTMNNSPVLDGNTLRYVDDRDNEVASFDLSDKAAVEEIMDGIISPFKNKQPRSLYSVLKMDDYDSGRGLNDVLFGVMAEAVGFTYKNDRGTTGIADLRKELDSVKSLISLYSFAPSPAGQHLRAMFEDKIASKQMQVDLMDRMGQRYIHLLKERGLSDGDIRTTLKTLMSESEATSRYEGRFINSSPVLISKGTILQQALTGFLRKNLASPSVPMFTDGDVNTTGFHEIGHFALGQAFTRHGEFVANAWPMFVHGRAFWSQFATTQRNQTDQFDQWTIKEHFGRVITPEQLLEITGRSDARDTIESVTRQSIKHLGLSDEDRAVVRDDVIKSVRARNDISDIEKQQVIDDINYTYDQGDFFITSTSQRKPAPKAVDEMAKLVDIPAELWDSNAESTRTSAFFDPLIPIPSRLFGWQRTDNSGFSSKTIDENAEEITKTVATLQQRREFASMLRAVNQMMGGRPVFMGNETPEEMRMVEKMMKEKKRLAQRKLSTIIDGLKRFYKKYPELRADFADEIKELGL